MILYRDMLKLYDHETLPVRRIKAIACEVCKTVNSVNPMFMKEMVCEKDCEYSLRDGFCISVPKFNKIRYGRNTFSFYGPQPHTYGIH